MQQAITKVLEVTKKAGKIAGHFALDAEAAAIRVRQGWDFVNCSCDLIAVTAGMSAEMKRLKDLTS